MKISLKTFLTVALILFSVQLFAQDTGWDNNTVNTKGDTYESIVFQGTVAGTDTLVSNEFNITGKNPVVTAYKFFNSATSKPKIKLIKKYKYFSNSTASTKTFYTADSLETQSTVADTLYGTCQLYFIGTGTNPSDTKINWMYIVKKE